MKIKHVNTVFFPSGRLKQNRSQLGSVGSKKTEISPARFKEWIDYFLPNGETRVFGPRMIFCDGFVLPTVNHWMILVYFKHFGAFSKGLDINLRTETTTTKFTGNFRVLGCDMFFQIKILVVKWRDL